MVFHNKDQTAFIDVVGTSNEVQIDVVQKVGDSEDSAIIFLDFATALKLCAEIVRQVPATLLAGQEVV